MKVVSAVLGGGRGSRLWPLTCYRAKPAVPIGGKFRLIDIPISNSLHAGIRRVFVLTQFSSASLHRHIAQTYRFDVFSEGFVNILAASQSPTTESWYQGTADAVRQNLDRLMHSRPSEVLILSGDQLYIMKIARFIEVHRENEADLTIAVKPVPASEAPALGIMRIEPDGRIVEFVEKPSDPDVIAGLALDEATIASLGIEAEPGMVLASMGIYTFRPEVLQKLLAGTTMTDFGREVIPGAISKYRVIGFVHAGYWRDIGTIPTFHQANIELTMPLPAMNLYSPDRPIYTHPRFLPGCKVNRCDVSNSVLCDGAIISSSRIADSIIGVRAVISDGCTIEQSVVMGAGRFQAGDENDRPHLGIGEGCEIRHAIIDLDARIGAGSRLVNEAGVEEADGDGYCIRGGVIVVHKDGVIAPGTVI